MISQTYDLNLIPSQIPVTIHCSQYDDGSRTFVFNLYEGASAFEIPAGASATFSGVKPDGLGFQYVCAITGASQVSVDVALQMTAVAGDCPCKVTVYDTDSNVLGSALCVLDVERHPLQDDTVISDSDFPIIQEVANFAEHFQPSDFVATNQGVAQAGKVLGIGNDGMVTPVQGGGGGGDTIFYDSLSDFPAIGEEDTLYVAKDTNQMYRWRTAVNAYINVGGGDAENVTYWRQDYPDVSLALDALFGRTDLSYKVDDASDTTIDDADYVPFYDTSASAKKKITWSNIVAKIKTSLANYFGRKLSQASGVLKLLANDDTELSSVTLSPLATNTSYTDTNSIGANNVQSAIDILSSTPTLLCTLTAASPSQSGIDISPYKILWFARRATNTNLWLCGDIGMAVPSFINNVRETYGRAYIQTFGDSMQERGWVSFNFSANNTITLSWDDEDTPPTYAEYYVYGIK